jgi:hypothetical protein
MGRIYTHRNRVFHLDVGTLDTWLEAQSRADLGQKELSAAAAWTRILDSDNFKIRRAFTKFEQMVGSKN